MSKKRINLGNRNEEFLAKLTTAAYGVALRHGLRTPFIEVQLEIWEALREILQGGRAGKGPLLSDDPEVCTGPRTKDRSEHLVA